MIHWYRWLIGAPVAVALAVGLALIAGGGQGSLAAGGTIYVDVDAMGANNGSSWGDAFTELQPALDAAATGDEIWVAAGTYKPTMAHGGTGDRYKSFQMRNGVALYGGFDPSTGDVAFGDRDWVTHETILSGDLSGDDGSGPANSAENSYHVFYHPTGAALDGTAILDGFTIARGFANGDSPHNNGGGMLNDGSSPALTHCTFSDNSAGHGSGMYNTNNSSPVMTNCAFSGNDALFTGGGMANDNGSSPALTDCTFSGNSASDGGGGMYNDGSSPVLSRCTFSDNTAGWNGGGGMSNHGSSPVLTNCTFAGNHATGGGGMLNHTSSPVLINCTFWRNRGEFGGGGMFNGNSSSPELTNCTFAGNSAPGGENGGGGMYNGDSSPALTNCILWGNSPNQFNANSSPAVTYSDIQGGYAGEGNIDTDPRFVNLDNGSVHIGPGSPCIDAGNNAAPGLPEYDFEGDDRIMDGDKDGTAIVDMGVDEAFWYAIHLPVVSRGY